MLVIARVLVLRVLAAGTGAVDLSAAAVSTMDFLVVASSGSTALGSVALGDGASNGNVALAVTTAGDLTLNGNLNTDTEADAGDLVLAVTGNTVLSNGGGTVVIDTDAGTSDAATAQPDPALEPPQPRSRSQGLRAEPKCGLMPVGP